MTALELNREFSDKFDIIYNNINSNQCPGLDAYEKSILLTTALNELVKGYFNPKLNKVQEGFDGSERRLIDFSMLITTKKFQESLNNGVQTISIEEATNPEIGNQDPVEAETTEVFEQALFDNNEESRAINIDNLGIFILTNEYVIVNRNGIEKKLTVVPITYQQYDYYMTKPYKRPNKDLAWRLIGLRNGKKYAELIVGYNDLVLQYVIRYVRKPRAIRLAGITDTIDGSTVEQSCELDPIMHDDIIQRAAELGKSIYAGNLESLLVLGLTSHTELGVVQSK